MRNIIFLTENNDVTIDKAINRWIAEEFEKFGVQVNMVGLATDANRVFSYLNQDTLFFLSFDCTGLAMTVRETSLFTAANKPLITILGDTIDRYADFVSQTDNRNVVFHTYDKNDAYYISRYLPAVHSFFPYEGIGLYREENVPDMKDKPFEISFCGNILPENLTRDIFKGQKWENISLLKFFDDVVDILLYNDSLCTLDAVERIADQYGILLGESDFNFHQIVRYAMLFVRSRRREIIMRELDKSGIAVEYFGFENQYAALGIQNSRFHGSIDVEGNIEVMRQSKIVLNTNSLTRAGLTRRQLSGMANGAVVLTDTNEANDKYFEDGEQYVMFKNSELKNIPGIVKDLLSNTGKMQEIADAARICTRDGFSLRRFVGQIMEAYEEIAS